MRMYSRLFHWRFASLSNIPPFRRFSNLFGLAAACVMHDFVSPIESRNSDHFELPDLAECSTYGAPLMMDFHL